jgi:aquaporin Z
MTIRSWIAKFVAEFMGTAVLTLAVINISRSQIGIGYFVAIGVGLTLSLLVLAIGPTSGAHVNPAVTLGMWTIRKINSLVAVGYIACQFLGAVVAWRLAEFFTGQKLNNIAGKSFEPKVLVAEAVGTFVFVFLIAAATYMSYRGMRWAATVGGGLFIGIIIATSASNGILNPAVALGAQSWGRAYIWGPFIGAVVAMLLYAVLFAPESVWVSALSIRRRTLVTGKPADELVAKPEKADKPARKTTAKTTATKATTAKPARSTRTSAKKPAARRSGSSASARRPRSTRR